MTGLFFWLILNLLLKFCLPAVSLCEFCYILGKGLEKSVQKQWLFTKFRFTRVKKGASFGTGFGTDLPFSCFLVSFGEKKFLFDRIRHSYEHKGLTRLSQFLDVDSLMEELKHSWKSIMYEIEKASVCNEQTLVMILLFICQMLDMC